MTTNAPDHATSLNHDAATMDNVVAHEYQMGEGLQSFDNQSVETNTQDQVTIEQDKLTLHGTDNVHDTKVKQDDFALGLTSISLEAEQVKLEKVEQINIKKAKVLTNEPKKELSSPKDDVLNEDTLPLAGDSNSAQAILTKLIDEEDGHGAKSAADSSIDEVTDDILGLSADDALDDSALALQIAAQNDLEQGAQTSGQEHSPALFPSDGHAHGDTSPISLDEEEGAELSAADIERFNKMSLKEGDRCPACGHGTLLLRQNDKVSFLGCSCYPKCKMRYFTARATSVTILKVLESTCPECGAQLGVKKGRYGLFIGCTNYPQCTYTYKEQEEHEGITCPVCKKGELEKRRARNGKIFYGCNQFPSCDFLVHGSPVLNPCKECGFPIRFKKRMKAGIALICANKDCASRRRRKQEIIEPN